jgi:hypothetical protein
MTSIESNVTPNSSATICAIPVGFPEPGEVTPVKTLTEPSGPTLTEDVS